jgi:hypothetical protein
LGHAIARNVFGRFGFARLHLVGAKFRLDSRGEDTLTDRLGVAMQFFHVSNLLLLAHEPSLGGLDEFIERQSVIKRCVDDIGCIAMTLTDNASSVISSQALFIGE